MTTPSVISTNPVAAASAPQTWQTDRAKQAYESTLRFLSDVAAAERERREPHRSIPLGPQCVRDVMVTSVVAGHEGAVFKEVVAALLRNKISSVPVIDADRRVVGVVSETDLMVRVAQLYSNPPRGHALARHQDERRKLHGTIASELMTSPAVVISPAALIESAAYHAARNRVRRMPVVDDSGILVGIVTRGDLLRPFLRPDTEIWADIVENVLHGSFILDRDALRVTVSEGVVTLDGHLRDQAMTYDVVETVRNLPGVVELDTAAVTFGPDGGGDGRSSGG
jgi:CBS domain-containing protein